MFMCKKCGAEFSSMLGDNQVPETCPYCGGMVIELEEGVEYE